MYFRDRETSYTIYFDEDSRNGVRKQKGAQKALDSSIGKHYP